MLRKVGSRDKRLDDPAVDLEFIVVPDQLFLAVFFIKYHVFPQMNMRINNHNSSGSFR